MSCIGRKHAGSAAWAGLVLMAAAGVCSADVLRVDHAARGNGSGATWKDAFPTLEAALAAAGAGDEVWVVAGRYVPTAEVTPGDARSAAFVIPSGVRVLGGFGGWEKAAEERDWGANATVLSGDVMGDDVFEEGWQWLNRADNVYQVVVFIGAEAGTVVDGFTISGGHADGVSLGAVPESKDQGAGVNIYYGAPTISNCVLERNWASNHGAVNDHGDNTRVLECTFRDNFSVLLGAGLYIHHHSATHAAGCVFERNRTLGDGGGLYSRSEHGAEVIDCLFAGNEALLGAGMHNAPGSATHVHGCEFRANAAEVGGGGFYTDSASPELCCSHFEDNTAGLAQDGGGGGAGGSGGGGVWCSGGEPVVDGCVFIRNRASFGAGVYIIDESAASVRECVFIGNEAREAGGVYVLASPAVIERCEFIENVAVGELFAVGGGVSSYFANTVVSGCTFLGNRATLGGGGIYNEGETPLVVNSTFVGNYTVGELQGWGGAVLNSFDTFAVIAGCEIIGNSARLGGGVLNLNFSDSRVVNCTLVDNSAEEGGGIWTHGASGATTANCIVRGNWPDQITGGGVTYSCVEGGAAGEGNIDADPRFLVAPSPGPDGTWGTADDEFDLRSSPGSPCHDAGANDLVPGFLMQDIGGRARIADDPSAPDSGRGERPIVDMGASEFSPPPPPPCRADFNGDGAVNSADVFEFLNRYFAGDADFNGDGVTSFADWLAFVRVWMAGCG